MNCPVVNPIPEVYVLWHPACEIGEFLATQIHRWLRPGKGLGPQVFYRSLPAPESPPGGLPPPLRGEVRQSGANPEHSWQSAINVQIVILLVEANMVADRVWRQWLNHLTKDSTRKFIPIALDSTAFNIVAPLREKNFLRPSGLPPTGAVYDQSAREKVAGSLLKQLTETLCRLMLGNQPSVQPGATPPPAADGELPKVKIFLSHAKVDGATPAKKIREYIYSQTQLAAFFDENDIPYTSSFSSVIQAHLKAGGTAGLIAVRSALYASRPWCRRELSLFRQPLREKPINGRKAEHWRLSPVVVVDALEARDSSMGIAEFGNSMLIRWSEDGGELEQHVVTTLLREIMLGVFHSALGRHVPDGPERIILNWPPDPTTLLSVLVDQSEDGKPVVRLEQDCTVVYPGRGLSGLELDILDEWFPNVVFRSFEDELS